MPYAEHCAALPSEGQQCLKSWQFLPLCAMPCIALPDAGQQCLCTSTAAHVAKREALSVSHVPDVILCWCRQ